MTKGREKSDGRVVPQARRKAGPTAPLATTTRGGKATTASKQADQLELFTATADSPQGDVAGVVEDRSSTVPRAVPKAVDATRESLLAMSSLTMERVASCSNLNRALDRVVANRGAPGPDRQTVDHVREHWSAIWPTLQSELMEGRYLPGMIRRVWIPKSSGGQRGLGIPDVVDRVVQQAVHQVLGPHYESTFHPRSHGFRPGRSCHTAIADAVEHVGDGFTWVVDLDLEKFFDRVSHDRLMSRLAVDVFDRRLLKLIRRMLEAKVVLPNGVVVSSEEGTPQGGPLSPLLSNIVLDELDKELDRRGHRFVRYADDCNIYVRSERSGQRVMASVTRFIEKRLRLQVNESKSAVARPEDRHFLGFRLRANVEEDRVEVLLSARSKERIDAKIRELTPRNWGGSLVSCIKRVNRYLLGWWGFFGIVSEPELRTLGGLDAHLRRRLRAIVLKQWRRKRTRAHRLIRLGVRAELAWRTLYDGRPRLWALSHRAAVDRAMPNAYFAERGLESLASRWTDLHRIVDFARQVRPG